MMKTRTLKFATLVVLLPLFVLAGCANDGSNTFGPKTGIGGALGAAGGGLLGAAAGGGTTGILAGVLLGGLAGGAVGNVLDQNDREMANRTSQRALESQPTGQASVWRNPDSGNSGSITPTRTFQQSDGRYCREFQQTVTIDGQENRAFGTACRQPDGSWQIIS